MGVLEGLSCLNAGEIDSSFKGFCLLCNLPGSWRHFLNERRFPTVPAGEVEGARKESISDATLSVLTGFVVFFKPPWGFSPINEQSYSTHFMPHLEIHSTCGNITFLSGNCLGLRSGVSLVGSTHPLSRGGMKLGISSTQRDSQPLSLAT